MDVPKKAGSIEVITGCMFAGKTEELLRRIRRIEFAKRSITVFKPLIDNRYGTTSAVVSHNFSKAPCYAIKDPDEVWTILGTDLPYAVAFDEAQFFSKEMVEVAESLADAGVRVIVAGLDLNFRGEPFGIMPDLLARAEEVTKLAAICQVCGAPATRTQRLIDGEPAKYTDPTIVVGASESYQARCRFCFEIPDKPRRKKPDDRK